MHVAGSQQGAFVVIMCTQERVNGFDRKEPVDSFQCDALITVLLPF